MVAFTWHACKYKVHKFHQKYIRWSNDVPLVEIMYLIFTRMPGGSYHMALRSLLLYLCYLINSLVCWFCTSALGLILFHICYSQNKLPIIYFYKHAHTDTQAHMHARTHTHTHTHTRTHAHTHTHTHAHMHTHARIHTHIHIHTYTHTNTHTHTHTHTKKKTPTYIYIYTCHWQWSSQGSRQCSCIELIDPVCLFHGHLVDLLFLCPWPSFDLCGQLVVKSDKLTCSEFLFWIWPLRWCSPWQFWHTVYMYVLMYVCCECLTWIYWWDLWDSHPSVVMSNWLSTSWSGN